MIYSLRRRHRRIWLVLALILPIGFIAAYMAIPQTINENEFEPWEAKAYSTIVNATETDNLLINLRKDENLPGLQIEIFQKQPFRAPGVVVYLAEQATENIRQANLLGRLDKVQEQRFTLNDFLSNFKEYHLLFYDSLKKEILETVKLK